MKPSEIAMLYLGNQELPGNKFIDDPKVDKDLGEILKLAGQKDGEAWCCYFAEAIYCLAYPKREKELRSLFSANCVQTFRNFKKAGFEISMTPRKDSLMIMQSFKSGVEQWSGHAGIVGEVFNNESWKSYEGNTNMSGGREGIEVGYMSRSNIRRDNGLNLIGFIYI